MKAKSSSSRAMRRIKSERASAYLEYVLLTSLVFYVACQAFRPGSAINESFGADLAFREVLIKLPIF